MALPAVVATIVPIVAIVGSITVAVLALASRARIRELRIRERMAMIEKGPVPSPEAGAAAPAPALDRADLHERWLRRHRWYGRHRRSGVLLLGAGLGLMPVAGLRVGGFVTLLGVAFLVNSVFEGEPGPPALPVPPVSPNGIRTPPPAGS